jgi:hypothetical protein
MNSKHLIHDHAWALAKVLVEMVEGCLRPEERREAFLGFYEAGKATLESYEEQAARMERRVRPSAN